MARRYPAKQKHLRDRFHTNRSRLSFLFGPRQTLQDKLGNLSHRCRANHLDLLGLQKNQANILHRCLRYSEPNQRSTDLTIHRQSIRLHERVSRSILCKVYSLFDRNFLENIPGDSCCTIFDHLRRNQQTFQVYIHHNPTILQSVADSPQDSLHR